MYAMYIYIYIYAFKKNRTEMARAGIAKRVSLFVLPQKPLPKHTSLSNEISKVPC